MYRDVLNLCEGIFIIACSEQVVRANNKSFKIISRRVLRKKAILEDFICFPSALREELKNVNNN